MGPSETPALAPPDGQTSNFDNPDGSRRRASYIMASICLILATIAVILRVFTKARVLRAMNAEEYFLIVSLFGLCAFVGVLLTATHFGSGVHQWDITMTDFGYFMDMINAAELIYFPTILCARIAMMVQVKRMFIPINQGVLFWVYVVLLCANIIFNTSLFFALLFACDPLDKLWDSSIPGHCINTVYVCLSSSAINGVSDLTMLILPLGVIIQLNLPLKVKLYLCAIFGTGALTTRQGHHVQRLPLVVLRDLLQGSRCHLGMGANRTLGDG
ncbi:hypothetical protein BDV59DRAFT_183097 [Aspergillus ambiguus]|uniref:uncharacterized protein n=1 Tax=Aspergillus ambiguus TaxID=176160 RepID=UPI003CCC9DEE